MYIIPTTQVPNGYEALFEHRHERMQYSSVVLRVVFDINGCIKQQLYLFGAVLVEHLIAGDYFWYGALTVGVFVFGTV